MQDDPAIIMYYHYILEPDSQRKQQILEMARQLFLSGPVKAEKDQAGLISTCAKGQKRHDSRFIPGPSSRDPHHEDQEMKRRQVHFERLTMKVNPLPPMAT